MTRRLALLASSLGLALATAAPAQVPIPGPVPLQVPPPYVPAGPGRVAVTLPNSIVTDSFPAWMRAHDHPLLLTMSGPPGLPPGLGCAPMPVAFGSPLGASWPVVSSPQEMASGQAMPTARGAALPGPAGAIPAPERFDVPSPPVPVPEPEEQEREQPIEADAEPYEPGLELTLVDLDDPISVGSDVIYLIQVDNRGNRVERDVRVTARLPEGLRFGGISGAGLGESDDGVVRFDPIDAIAPGEELRWRLLANANQAGPLRVRVELEGASGTAPLTEEEPTIVVPSSGSPPIEPEPEPEPAPEPEPEVDSPDQDD